MIQAGGYGEHHVASVVVGGRTFPIDAPYFTVRLAPGSGDTLTINLKRYAHQPTLAFPWDRGWMMANMRSTMNTQGFSPAQRR